MFLNIPSHGNTRTTCQLTDVHDEATLQKAPPKHIKQQLNKKAPALRLKLPSRYPDHGALKKPEGKKTRSLHRSSSARQGAPAAAAGPRPGSPPRTTGAGSGTPPARIRSSGRPLAARSASRASALPPGSGAHPRAPSRPDSPRACRSMTPDGSAAPPSPRPERRL